MNMILAPIGYYHEPEILHDAPRLTGYYHESETRRVDYWATAGST